MQVQREMDLVERQKHASGDDVYGENLIYPVHKKELDILTV